MLTPGHSLNAFSEPRPGRTLELIEASKQSRRVSRSAYVGFAAFGKWVQLISGSPYAETEQISRQTSQCDILAIS